MYKGIILVFTGIVLMLAAGACSDGREKMKEGNVHVTQFGTLSGGKTVKKFRLSNETGMTAEIIEYGAALVSLTCPDRHGEFRDVLLGYDNLEGYVRDRSYFGGIVGRYGNRIAQGRFSLNGETYQLTINNGENHLHGGLEGFNKKLWRSSAMEDTEEAAVWFEYTSPDGEQGYPGEVTLRVTYALTNDDELRIEYDGTATAPTILNPTSHAYFNLSGDCRQTILGHELMIDANRYTPVDEGQIPTGELASVEGTPMDFREPMAIGARIGDDFDQFRAGNGYDHNWALNGFDGSVRKVAELFEPESGRLLEVLTDQPGLQFYSGNFLDQSVTGKKSMACDFRTGLCLEAQYFPDSPNNDHFPPVTLLPGEPYRQVTIYRFSVR